MEIFTVLLYTSKHIVRTIRSGGRSSCRQAPLQRRSWRWSHSWASDLSCAGWSKFGWNAKDPFCLGCVRCELPLTQQSNNIDNTCTVWSTNITANLNTKLTVVPWTELHHAQAFLVSPLNLGGLVYLWRCMYRFRHLCEDVHRTLYKIKMCVMSTWTRGNDKHATNLY